MTIRRIIVDHVLFVVEDLDASRRLYTTALAPLGYSELHVQDDGFSIRPVDQAFARFTEKRAKYAPRLDALAVLLAAPPGLWIGDRSYLGARTAH